jgi:hypothetical protein
VTVANMRSGLIKLCMSWLVVGGGHVLLIVGITVNLSRRAQFCLANGCFTSIM